MSTWLILASGVGVDLTCETICNNEKKVAQSHKKTKQNMLQC